MKRKILSLNSTNMSLPFLSRTIYTESSLYESSGYYDPIRVILKRLVIKEGKITAFDIKLLQYSTETGRRVWDDNHNLKERQLYNGTSKEDLKKICKKIEKKIGKNIEKYIATNIYRVLLGHRTTFEEIDAQNIPF